MALQSNRPLLARPALWLALAALLASAGCSAWRLRDAALLARESEPFQAAPVAANASLLVVGDSTAVGTGASFACASVPGLLAVAQPGLRVVNRAADGARYADIVRQLHAGDERFDAVLVLGGGNDVIRGTSARELRSRVRQAAQLARQRADIVVFMPPGNVGHAPFFWPPLSWWMSHRSQGLHAAVREAAVATGATYVNLLLPRAQDPFAQQPALLHASDGLHPSDAGYGVWMAQLEQQAALSRKIRVVATTPAGPHLPTSGRPARPAAASRAAGAAKPGS